MNEFRRERTAGGRRRFGNKSSGMAQLSLAEIGRMFGVSLQSIQCVEQRALRKLREGIMRDARESGQSLHEYLFGD